MGLFDALKSGVTSVVGEQAPDLTGWAAERGLLHHAQDNIVGYSFTLKPDWPDVRRNVMSGALPGGEQGVIFHNIGKNAKRQTEFGHTTAPVQFTRIGCSIPAGIAGIQRFRVSTAAEEPPGWSEIPADQLGLRGRHFYCSPNADIEMIKRAMSGGLAERFSALDPAVTPNYRFGTLLFAKDRLSPAEEIEALCQELSACAAILRDSAGPGSEEALEGELPAPFYFDAASVPGRQVATVPPYPQTGDIEGVGLDQLLSAEWGAMGTALGTAYPDAGLVPEDTLSFYRAFPRFPVPGQAVIVARGKLPGTAIQGRTVVLADNYPDSFNFGFDAFVVDAGGTEDTPGPHEETGYFRYAVRDGLACIWRARQETRSPAQLDPASYELFANDASSLIESKGWSRAPRAGV